MDEFIFIVKIGILVLSLCAMLSFHGQKSNAKKTTKDLLDEDFNDEAKPHELDILRDVHHIKTSETIFTTVIQGDLEVTELTTAGMGGEQLTTIGGVMVELPYHEIKTYLEQTQFLPKDIVSKIAAYDGKLYVLSLQDYWLGQGDDEQTGQSAQYVVEPGAEFESDSSAASTSTYSASNPTQPEIKAEEMTSNVEILSERKATEVEQWHFDPVKPGFGWMAGVVALGLLFAFFLEDANPNSAGVIVFFYLFVAVILLWLWNKGAKRARQEYTIVKMRGEIESINDYHDIKCIRIQRPTNWKKYDEYSIPEQWLDKTPLNKTTSFEVCVELGQVVSVQPYYSIEQQAKSTNKSANLHLRYMALSFIVSSLFFFMFMGPAKLSAIFGMLSHPELDPIAKQSQFVEAGNVGQRISIDSIGAMCADTYTSSHNLGTCTSYGMFDTLPHVDIKAISEPFIVKLWHINDDVPKRRISNSAYIMLSSYARIYGQTLEPQYNIVSINRAAIAKWAKWVEINPTLEGFKQSKQELVRLWQSLSEDESCESDACWQEILAHDLEDVGETDYVKRYKVSDLMAMKGEAVDIVIAQWMEAVNDAQKQAASQSNTVIHLVGYEGEPTAWDKLKEYRGSGGTVSSDKTFKRRYLEGVVKMLNEQQSLALDYGVVVDVAEQGQQTHLYVDTSYTEDKFVKNLIQLGLVFGLLLVGLILALLAWMDARSLRASNSSKQTAWVS
ncbi:hypothetical protein [Vibrio intestinalis]|uniref:hypothetical protein n=1 Tax=Vibrio intestinalis TaxID=2933291 RepID=UPI0021A327AC|nr:hypothetical protein [Vibrio intestinalis]